MVHTAILFVSLVCKTVQAFSVMSEPDPGFDTFFTTNLEEMLDVPIQFDKPLPSWLRGTLIRNGLGMFEVGRRNFTHSFDAFGKLASWKFYGNGSASFSTNILKSDFYKDSIAKDDIAPYLMFESVKPSFNEFQKMEALLRGIDNMNVNVYRFFNRQGNNYEYVVLNDFWKIYQINP
ncbi:BCDO1 [Mytilus edulis]|uniref:BCMO1 n=1 Tax=Mytilus edulis TaxID=6550 RepID=A0A8S3SA22_MYTED|nr:BCDO1 [Mytilus edulis]